MELESNINQQTQINIEQNEKPTEENLMSPESKNYTFIIFPIFFRIVKTIESNEQESQDLLNKSKSFSNISDEHTPTSAEIKDFNEKRRAFKEMGKNYFIEKNGFCQNNFIKEIREGHNKDKFYVIDLLENQEEGYIKPFKPYDIDIMTYCLINNIVSAMEERKDLENFVEDKICCCLKEDTLDTLEEWRSDIVVWKKEFKEFYNQRTYINIQPVKLCIVATFIIIFALILFIHFL